MALGEDNKEIGYAKFKPQFHIEDAQIAYIGDDELDIPFETSRFRLCPTRCTPFGKIRCTRMFTH